MHKNAALIAGSISCSSAIKKRPSAAIVGQIGALRMSKRSYVPIMQTIRRIADDLERGKTLQPEHLELLVKALRNLHDYAIPVERTVGLVGPWRRQHHCDLRDHLMRVTADPWSEELEERALKLRRRWRGLFGDDEKVLSLARIIKIISGRRNRIQ